MSHSKILIVDDEQDICEILAFNLQNEGYETYTSNSAEEALELLDDSIKIILLDIMMGGMSGYQFADTIRKNGYENAIIFITAKDSEEHLLTGFSLGADDFITKPFSIKEVIARVNALDRRMQVKEKAQVQEGKPQPNLADWRYETLRFSHHNKELWIDDEQIALTKKEYEIFNYLIKNQDHIISREELIDNLWDTSYVTNRTVDVHIARLRKKIGRYAGMIINKSGYGYRLDTTAL